MLIAVFMLIYCESDKIFKDVLSGNDDTVRVSYFYAGFRWESLPWTGEEDTELESISIDKSISD